MSMCKYDYNTLNNRIEITHYLRDRKGRPFGDPITFICTEADIREVQDTTSFPHYFYSAFDGSVWYGVMEEEMKYV